MCMLSDINSPKALTRRGSAIPVPIPTSTLHGVQECLQPLGLCVDALEQTGSTRLDLVLRLSGMQRLAERAPEPIEPGVGHLRDAADIGPRFLVEEDRRLASVPVPGVG